VQRLNDRIFSAKVAGMSILHDLRKDAANCVVLAEAADSDPKRKRYERMVAAWNAWLIPKRGWMGKQK
jgi:hypothetical protein